MRLRCPKIVSFLVLFAIGFVAIVVLLVWHGLSYVDTPTSEFNTQEAVELNRRVEAEKKELESVAEKLAVELAEERGIAETLKDADEKKKKIEILKIQYEAALLVGACNTNDILFAASDLGHDAEERVRISHEFHEIDRRVRAIKESLDWEKSNELEKRLERLRKGESGVFTRPPDPDFRDIFAKFYGAATDEDRLRWALQLKRMTLSEQDIVGLCSFYDCLTDAKTKYLVVDILCSMVSQAATAKLLDILAAEPDWPMKQMIGYSLEGHYKEIVFEPGQIEKLVRIFDAEQSPQVRERLARVIGLFAASEQSAKLLDVAENDPSMKVRMAALEFLNVSEAAHKIYMLTLVREKLLDSQEKAAAWHTLCGVFYPEFSENEEISKEISAKGMTDDVIIRLRGRERPDEDIYNTLVAALRGEFEDNDLRQTLMNDEHLVLWPAFWPDYPLTDVVKQVAETDADEDVRWSAANLLEIWEGYEDQQK